MAIASVTLVLLLIPTLIFMLIFPVYQIAFAQNDVGTLIAWYSVIGVVLGGVIGAAVSIIGISLTNRHNMKVKKQEAKT